MSVFEYEKTKQGNDMTDKEKLIENHIKDITKLFPGKLLLSKKELAQLRNTSESSINREKAQAKGVNYKVQNGRIMYPIRSIAEWMADITRTTNF